MKVEKINDFTVQITSDKIVQRSYSSLLVEQTQLLDQQKKLEERLAEINQIILESDKLGIKERLDVAKGISVR